MFPALVQFVVARIVADLWDHQEIRWRFKVLDDNRVAQQWAQLKLFEVIDVQMLQQLLLQIIQGANLPANPSVSV